MDRRGIYDTELWDAVLWAALLLFVFLQGAWLEAWTWSWTIALIVLACVVWLCVIQYGAAKKRSRQRRKEAVRSKVLALPPEQRRDLNELARRGEICLSGNDAEEQIDAVLRRWTWPGGGR